MSSPARKTARQNIAEEEWQRLIVSTPAYIRSQIAEIVGTNAVNCVNRFYAVLLEHPSAGQFLTIEAVDSHLRSSLAGWLTQLFSTDSNNAHTLAATQRDIGAVHARIDVPIHVVMHGARVMKGEIRQHIFVLPWPSTELAAAAAFVEDMIDIAIEFMSKAFVHNIRRDAEKDEAFRLMSLGQDMNLEREIQRAALFDWRQKLLFSVCYGDANLPPLLANSEFGLWLHHKGDVLFHGRTELKHIHQNVIEIDEKLTPALLATTPPPLEMVNQLQTQMEEIHILTDQLFKTAEAIEGGRDPLTKTLSRRFLPTILSREIAVSHRRNVEFSIIMVDIDHFKSVNQKLGHVGGDTILRSVAEILVTSCRTSDFIFRYGGEEFLVVLIETAEPTACDIAERIRRTVEESPVITIDGHDLKVTVSIGIATFDGHPDYLHLIEAADQALYIAKAEGRNRCHLALREASRKTDCVSA